jgi:pantetheine-phosphate adenylyltransferase
MKRACFPGSFDPFTKGHEDIVRRGLTLFDEIIIAIGNNSSKQSLFSLSKRIEHIQSIFNNDSRIQVASYEGLTTLFCEENPVSYTHLRAHETG